MESFEEKIVDTNGEMQISHGDRRFTWNCNGSLLISDENYYNHAELLDGNLYETRQQRQGIIPGGYLTLYPVLSRMYKFEESLSLFLKYESEGLW